MDLKDFRTEIFPKNKTKKHPNNAPLYISNWEAVCNIFLSVAWVHHYRQTDLEPLFPNLFFQWAKAPFACGQEAKFAYSKIPTVPQTHADQPASGTYLFACDCAVSCHCFFLLFFFLHSQQMNNVLTASSHSHLCSTVSHGKHVMSLQRCVSPSRWSLCVVPCLCAASICCKASRYSNESWGGWLLSHRFDIHTHTHIHQGRVGGIRITLIHLGSFTVSLPGSSMCGKLLRATYISLKQKPSGLDHLTLPKIHTRFPCSTDISLRFAEAVAKWSTVSPRATQGPDVKENWGIFRLIFSTCLFALLACQLTHQVRKMTTCVFLDGVTAQKRLVWILCDFRHRKSTSLL